MTKSHNHDDVTDVFGSNVFNDRVMKERLPKDTYKALKETIEKGSPLTLEVANVVANAMKDWAIEKGATHYTHWFQPLTGKTAEKHILSRSRANDRHRAPWHSQDWLGIVICVVPPPSLASHWRYSRISQTEKTQ
jgi:hypothetical protein